MVKILTESGFECELEDDYNNDFEFLSISRELDHAQSEGNDAEAAMLLMDLGKLLLGKAQYAAMLNHLKKVNNVKKVGVLEGYKELTQIIQKASEVKKK